MICWDITVIVDSIQARGLIARNENKFQFDQSTKDGKYRLSITAVINIFSSLNSDA